MTTWKKRKDGEDTKIKTKTKKKIKIIKTTTLTKKWTNKVN